MARGAMTPDQFSAALKAAAGDLNDLKAVHRAIAKMGEANVKAHVPVYGGSSKDSKSHKGPGYLKKRVRGRWTAARSYIEIRDSSGVLILQEFGGTSRWYRGQSHEYVTAVIGTSKRGHDITRQRRQDQGHAIYRKPRKKTGYFIWNVAYRLREEIAAEYQRGVFEVCNKHEISIDLATSPHVSIKEVPWGG